MGYGLTPWGITWGDPASGYTLSAVIVSGMIGAASVSALSALSIGVVGASVMLTASSIAGFVALNCGAVSAAPMITATAIDNTTSEAA